MLDRNTLIGFTLILALLVGWAYFLKPSDAEIEAYKRQQDSTAIAAIKQDSLIKSSLDTTQNATVANTNDSNVIKNSFGSFAAAATGTESFTTLENEELKITFSNKGGRIYKVQLKKYSTYSKENLLLMDGAENQQSFDFPTTDNKIINTGDLYFSPTVAENGKSLSMRVSVGPNQYIEQNYAFDADSHILKYAIRLVGMENIIQRNRTSIDVNWVTNIRAQEKTREAEERVSTIYYRIKDDEPNSLSEGKEVKESIASDLQWVSFKQQYFNQTIIADKGFTDAVLETKNDPYKNSLRKFNAILTIPYNHSADESFAMKIYYGPNHYKTLEKLGISLERIVPMGWGIFRWVNKYIVVNVFSFLSKYIGSFGIIILLLTLIIKTALLPLVYKSYLSAAKMRLLKPELDEIKEKHGDDMTKIQQENMKMYRKAGVNPFGGCIPVLLQLPILFAMFQFFPSAFELRQQSFLWAEDLSTYDNIFNLPFSIPLYGNHVSLFALLMTVSSVAYALYNNQATGVTGQMKWLGLIMPVVFLFTLNSFAAGLNYYYFVSNLVTILQQLTIKLFVDEKKLHSQLQENKKKPQQKSKFQQKLEDMAKKRGVDLNNLGKK
jgi:YidC/Oxa1 family membrane protein insertase